MISVAEFIIVITVLNIMKREEIPLNNENTTRETLFKDKQYLDSLSKFLVSLGSIFKQTPKC